MTRPAQESASPTDDRSRLAKRVFPDGCDPDPRFTLANERTFLAWVRTGLALQAAGIAVEAFAVFEGPPGKSVAVLLLILGMFVTGGSFVRWIGVERALRNQRSLPLPLIAPVLGISGAVGAVVLIYVILRG